MRGVLTTLEQDASGTGPTLADALAELQNQLNGVKQ